MNYDLVVLGGGPGGCAAAFEGAALGLKIALVERGPLGGVCLNWGCIPTKLFLGATAAIPALKAQARLKLLDPASGMPVFDLPALQQRKARLVNGSRQALARRLAAAGVDVLVGSGRLCGPDSLEVSSGHDTRRIGFSRLILATGSSPVSPRELAPDGCVLLNSTHLLDLTEVPESLLVIGGGAIGLELGEFFHRLGARIALVEAGPHLLPAEDPELGKTLGSLLTRQRWTLRLGCAVASCVRDGNDARVRLTSGEELCAAKVLVATGRRPDCNALGLESAGIACDTSGFVVTDACLRANETIYAIGDVNGRAMLAHAATHQASYAVRHAAGHVNTAYDPGPTPACVYGTVEVVRCGRGQHEYPAGHPGVRVSRSHMAANPIAQAAGEPQGYVKVVWENGRVRGISALGHDVTHLSALCAMIVKAGLTRAEAQDILFAHPTLEEALAEALLAESSPA